ncbi:uncharacterized protein [Oryza sativa Japonica Group]|uniref:uncharacterized protein isoform X3 n=1 Tax=Oryza sativa subsp. japonica TaxID=39947 RepID=UPI0027ABB1B6|nr:hypothetical protein DAI22_07g240700 [Oryza sativa Japonica Group]
MAAAAAAAAAAASTARGGHRPWTAASRGVSARRCSVAPAQVRARGPTEWWPAAARRRRAPRRHAVAAKAGAADARPSSSSDAVSYSSSISTDMPLYEPTGVSFDEYLLDRARVFRAMFPDESRSQRLSDEEWRVQMLPLQFLLLTVHPVVVMQLRHRDGVLDLRIVHGVGAAWAGARLRAGELRPRRPRVALRRQEPRPPRLPAEGPPRDLHRLRPAAADAPRAGRRHARRRRVGAAETGREDEAGRRRRHRRRLPEIPAGEGRRRRRRNGEGELHS